MTRYLHVSVAFVLLLLLGVRSAAATPITYTFSGTIGSSTIAGISVGDPIVGTFVYDPDAPLSISTPSFKDFSPTVARIDATIGGNPYASTLIDEGLGDDFIPAIPPIVPLVVYDAFVLNANALAMVFLDADATFFNSFASLPSSLPLSEFEYTLLEVLLPGADPAFGDVALGRVSVAPAVPEPASLVLLGTGLAAVIAKRRRRVFKRRTT